MAKTQVHEIEIAIEDGQLKITPYRLQIQYHDSLTPRLVGDTTKKGKVFKCALTKKNHELVAYILDLDEWELRGNWDGYSDWQFTDYLRVGDTPERLKKWLDELPIYELRLEYKE